MWKFEKLNEGDPERDPHEAEFFKVGDLNLSSTLVREFIQNSLDAKLKDDTCIKVIFTFGSTESKNLDMQLKGLIEHVNSSKILETNTDIKKHMNYLTVEDFGTTGLDGSLTRPDSGQSSNFYNFWQREGKSQKTGKNAGRWGLGKTVYHIASKLRSFWGYSKRYDDEKKLLQGKALLVTHNHKGDMYNYFGYYRNEDKSPIEDFGDIENFCNIFSISRKGESGLSIVIPLPNDEITIDEIIKSVIIHYFFPIIKGNLIVELSFNDKKEVIDEANISKHALNPQNNWNNTPWKDRDVKSIMRFVEEAATMPERNFFQLHFPDERMTAITENLIGDKLEELRNKFSDNKLLCFRVPVNIEPEGAELMKSFFYIYIQRDNNLKKADEFYIRSGITISELKRLSYHRSVRALLYAFDHPVSMFLGDSEAPAHIDWNERTKDFREKYKNAVPTLRFIRNSMRDLVKLLDLPPEEQDINFLKDVFFIREGYREDNGQKTAKQDPVTHQSEPSLVKISKIRNGIKLSLNEENINLPIQVNLKIAYDVLHGNPFNKYSRFDFDLSSNSLKIKKKGCSLIEADKNIALINITHKDFELKISGFDSKRDLIVHVKKI